jgi:hypothetical protein
MASVRVTNPVPEWARREADRALAKLGYESGDIVADLIRGHDRLERNILAGRQAFDDGNTRSELVEFVMFTERVSRRTAYRRTTAASEAQRALLFAVRVLYEHWAEVEAQLVAGGRTQAAARLWRKRHPHEVASAAAAPRRRG